VQRCADTFTLLIQIDQLRAPPLEVVRYSDKNAQDQSPYDNFIWNLDLRLYPLFIDKNEEKKAQQPILPRRENYCG